MSLVIPLRRNASPHPPSTRARWMVMERHVSRCTVLRTAHASVSHPFSLTLSPTDETCKYRSAITEDDEGWMSHPPPFHRPVVRGQTTLDVPPGSTKPSWGNNATNRRGSHHMAIKYCTVEQRPEGSTVGHHGETSASGRCLFFSTQEQRAIGTIHPEAEMSIDGCGRGWKRVLASTFLFSLSRASN